mmetsp:Transcript_67007/g.123456  ORF Transcript_67007/g.123456 Transcript_67007/m.123456 type:complete len:124 (-) Transcript_67007:103-474(-)
MLWKPIFSVIKGTNTMHMTQAIPTSAKTETRKIGAAKSDNQQRITQPSGETNRNKITSTSVGTVDISRCKLAKKAAIADGAIKRVPKHATAALSKTGNFGMYTLGISKSKMSINLNQLSHSLG